MNGDGFQSSGGWIEVIAGVMFSGKSEELMRRVRRALIARKRVQVFKSHLDRRYAGLYKVSSHDGRTIEAVPVDSAEQIELGEAYLRELGGDALLVRLALEPRRSRVSASGTRSLSILERLSRAVASEQLDAHEQSG